MLNYRETRSAAKALKFLPYSVLANISATVSAAKTSIAPMAIIDKENDPNLMNIENSLLQHMHIAKRKVFDAESENGKDEKKETENTSPQKKKIISDHGRVRHCCRSLPRLIEGELDCHSLISCCACVISCGNVWV